MGKLLTEQGKADSAKYRFDRIEQVVVPNIKKLLSYCRSKKIRVIFITIGSEMPDYSDLMPNKLLARAINNTQGFREHEILDELKPLQEECVINKLTTSAFTGSNFDHVLRSMGIEYLLFTGVSTNSCVDLTARDAADRGYKCVLIEDCLGAAKEEYHKKTLLDFQRLMGRVETMKEIIAELEGTTTCL